MENGVVAGSELLRAVGELDEAVASIEGHGFEPTPFAAAPALAEAVGIGNAELWVKDETGNVSGSHKARHLFGVALGHCLSGRTDRPVSGQGVAQGRAAPEHDASGGGVAAVSKEPPYVIASCGNAALAAAVVARAVGRSLDVYVPTWANDAVVAQITDLGGRVLRCERESGVVGDPAHHAMLSAIGAGAVPFSCQGTETPAAIDGGRTLAWEMVDTLVAHAGARPARLDRLFVQVGGGALATAVVTGLAAAVSRGDLTRMPTVHAVQPRGNHPLVRAWDTLALELHGSGLADGEYQHSVEEALGQDPTATIAQPVEEVDRSPVEVDRFHLVDQSRLAAPATVSVTGNRWRARIAVQLGPLGDDQLGNVLRRLRDHPGHYMRAWEQEPWSYASGILDDITYDWVQIVEAMLMSGGWPLVASEQNLRCAHRLAHVHTGIDVCPTGASGLGGLLALNEASSNSEGAGIAAGERVAVLFTGRMRPGDPDPLAALNLN